MNTLESKVPLASNCARATPARPHSSGYNALWAKLLRKWEIGNFNKITS